jgi:release factor H-coupled RctB family protein
MGNSYGGRDSDLIYSADQTSATKTKIKPTVIASSESWMEGEALRQLDHTANLPGMKRAVGLPDLHPGKGIPIGAAFLSSDLIYPHLVGNDIGCGMGLWQTDIIAAKFKLDKSVKRLSGFEDPYAQDVGGEAVAAELATYDLPADLWPYALGTIGSGNHFAEFQAVAEVVDTPHFEAAGLDKTKLSLLVHSGSRGLGQSILEAHVRTYKGGGLRDKTDAFDAYIKRHDQAVLWAEVNRRVIATRFMTALRTDGPRLLDVCHNSVSPHQGGWLHRKGAAPSDKGLVVIPGSRGTLSYLVRPRRDVMDLSLCSLAHGAGRKWKRSDVKGRLSKRYSVSDLTRTPLGGRVICEDKTLMFEEAPEAYKDVSVVISDLQDFGLIDVIATLKPVITYKTRRR